jgi:hypothetical protein
MSDEVEVEYGENAGETATLLLAAAEELGLEPYVVRTSTNGDTGVFVVPAEVRDKVFTKAGNVKKSAASAKDKE